MGKRKHKKQDNYEYIAKKLKKLEKKLKHSRKKRQDSTSSTCSSDNSMSLNNEADSYYVENDENNVDEVENILEPPATSTGPIPFTSTEPVTESFPLTSMEPSADIDSQEKEDENMVMTTEVDSAILELLGDDPSVTKCYSKEINSDLAVRLQHIATAGLSKELKRDLQQKYLPPSNCTQIDAPLLNPEIKAALNDIVQKRDKGIEVKQKVLGSAIACVGEAISILLNEENKNTNVIKLLMDASRLICDCQNTDSITRRNFVLYNLKKDMKSQIQKTKIDTYLFGSDLPETLKTAKFISKSGDDLKMAPAPKIQANKRSLAPITQKNNLNWKAPPPSRRLRTGNPRMKEPAQRNPHASSFRPSYRPPPPPPPTHPAPRTRYRP